MDGQEWKKSKPRELTLNMFTPQMKLKLSALQCLFFIIHVSVGKLFAYLINGIQNLLFTGERQRLLASQNQDNSQDQLSLEDQVAKALNRILNEKTRK